MQNPFLCNTTLNKISLMLQPTVPTTKAIPGVQPKAQTIAIIGGGFSGAMVATHLLRQATHPLQIKLIERYSSIGRGVAYNTPFGCHLLNVPAGKMSAFPDLPDHFLNWLNQQPLAECQDAESVIANQAQFTADQFVSRNIYGSYIRAVLAEAQTIAAEGVQLECLQDEAEAIYPAANYPAMTGGTIHLKSGQLLQANQIILALGNFPAAAPPVANQSFYQSARYISNPWSGEVESVDLDQPVLLIGSGLTMLDWALALHQRGFRNKIYVVSRRGLLPQAHRATLPYALTINGTANQPEFPATVRLLLRWLRQKVKLAQQQGSDWRAVIDALRPHTQAIWQALPLAERRRFLRHLRPYWEVHRHRVAPKVAETMSQLIQTGQIQLQAGRIQAYREHDQGVEVSIRPRQQTERLIFNVGTVVNCTGTECNYRNLGLPLIESLVQAGLVQADPLGLGFAVTKNGALLQVDGQASNWLFTLGATQKGQLWETTAIPELRQQAANLAQVLLQQNYQLSVSDSYQISRSRSLRYSNAL